MDIKNWYEKTVSNNQAVQEMEAGYTLENRRNEQDNVRMT